MPFNKIKRTLIYSRKRPNYKCLLCNQSVLHKKSLSGRRFGLLEYCNHAFCIHCLQEHVRLDVDFNKINLRLDGEELLNRSILCPVCKLPSSFILSSPKLFLNCIEKDLYVQEFQRSLSTFHCPFLKRGIPFCYCVPSHGFPEPYALFSCFRNF